jgi:putative endonuclease
VKRVGNPSEKPSERFRTSRNDGNARLYTQTLTKRVHEHKNGLVDGFSKKYQVHRLVYYEVAKDAKTALLREKQMKKWNRVWKLRLIEEYNPEWADLSNGLMM